MIYNLKYYNKNTNSRIPHFNSSLQYLSMPYNNTTISNDISIPLKNIFNLEKMFCFIWMFGVTLSIVILVIGNKKLKNIVRTSIKNINIKHSEILKNCMKDMNIKTEVELSYSKKISSPSLCGFFKPKMLVTASIGNRIIETTSMVLNKVEMKRRIIMISKYNKINIKDIILILMKLIAPQIRKHLKLPIALTQQEV